MERGSLEATSGEEGVEASATPDEELLVSSPASVIGPRTPEAAANRRSGQKFLVSDAESYDRGFLRFT